MRRSLCLLSGLLLFLCFYPKARILGQATTGTLLGYGAGLLGRRHLGGQGCRNEPGYQHLANYNDRHRRKLHRTQPRSG